MRRCSPQLVQGIDCPVPQTSQHACSLERSFSPHAWHSALRNRIMRCLAAVNKVRWAMNIQGEYQNDGKPR
jgi:hypothetical protein